ncbi:MAG: family 43 glycosylhydrolase, partial [Acidimicrobiia bacterium]|nr:family 43 glycosylhydrolase [Acidimicrobiia bacterium]
MRRLLLALAVVIVVAGAVAAQLEVGGRLASRRSELAAARSVLASTDAELGDVSARDGAMATRVLGTMEDVAGTGAEAEDTAEELAGRTAERDRLGDSLDAVTAQLEGARFDLEAVSVSSWLQGAQIGDLGSCLDGVARATAGRVARDPERAVDALQEVSGPCREAEDAVAPGASPLAFPYDFADPYVLGVGSTYFAYSTNGGGGNIQLIRSDDLGGWAWIGDALPALPAWANPHFTWAPSVLARAGGYVMYYA